MKEMSGAHYDYITLRNHLYAGVAQLAAQLTCNQ